MFDTCASAASTLANSPRPVGMSLRHISIASPVVLAGQVSHTLEAAVDVPSGSVRLASVGSKPAPAQLHCSCTVARVQQASAVAGQSMAPLASGLSADRHRVASALRLAGHHTRQHVHVPAMACIAAPGAAQLSGHSMHPARSDAVLRLSAAWLTTAAPLQIPVGMSALAIQGIESGKGCGWGVTTVTPSDIAGTTPYPPLNFSLKTEQQTFFNANCLTVREVCSVSSSAASTAVLPASLVYGVEWQVSSQLHAGQLAQQQSADMQQARRWSVVRISHGSISSTPSTFVRCNARSICSAAGVAAAVTGGLELLQQQSAGKCMLQIDASPGMVPSLRGTASAMPAATSASLEALAKVAAAEGGNHALHSGRVDCTTPVAVQPTAMDVLGTAAVGGSLLRAKLLRHALHVVPANSHLLPLPRGSLADLKLKSYELEAPLPGTVRVSPQHKRLTNATASATNFLLATNWLAGFPLPTFPTVVRARSRFKLP